jgi:predicted phosphodiesterase
MNRDISLPRGTKVTVVGDVHEHERQFDEIVERIQPCREHRLVSIGDIYDKGFGPRVAESITKKLKRMVEDGVAYVIRGNHEQRHLRRSTALTSGLQWFATLGLSLSFRFHNQTKLLIVHAGVAPSFTTEDLVRNVETLYLRTLDERGNFIPLKWKTIEGKRRLVPMRDGKPWHEYYDGRFGYIISGHDSQADGEVKFYPYSCNLDTKCYQTGVLSAITYGENGREDLIRIEGPAARPKI